jgi:hypothetical protein
MDAALLLLAVARLSVVVLSVAVLSMCLGRCQNLSVPAPLRLLQRRLVLCPRTLVPVIRSAHVMLISHPVSLSDMVPTERRRCNRQSSVGSLRLASCVPASLAFMFTAISDNNHDAVFTTELESSFLSFASSPPCSPCTAAQPDKRAQAVQHAHPRRPLKAATPSLWLWVLSASVCMFMQTLEVSTPASRPGRASSTIMHDMACMRSCDFSRFAAAVERLPAAPAALRQFWLAPAACGNRTALRIGDSIAWRAWWRYPALLASAPHLTFRLTGALGNLLKSLMVDGGASWLDPLECGTGSPAAASTGRSTSVPTHRSPTLAQSSAALPAEGSAPASLYGPAPEACERGCETLAWAAAPKAHSPPLQPVSSARQPFPPTPSAVQPRLLLINCLQRPPMASQLHGAHGTAMAPGARGIMGALYARASVAPAFAIAYAV